MTATMDQRLVEQTKANIKRLEWFQHEHDRLFHKDIDTMPVKDRIKHFVFHLTKYGCDLACLERQGGELDVEKIRKLLIDSLIICVSLANTLQLRLWNAVVPLATTNTYKGFHDDCLRAHAEYLMNTYVPLGQPITDINQPTCPVRMDIVLDCIDMIGKMAKCVEAWDHFEKYPYIDNLKELTPRYFNITLIAMHYFGITHIYFSYLKRLKEVQKKHHFYDMLGKTHEASMERYDARVEGNPA